jgi:hypothetical protein
MHGISNSRVKLLRKLRRPWFSVGLLPIGFQWMLLIKKNKKGKAIPVTGREGP